MLLGLLTITIDMNVLRKIRTETLRSALSIFGLVDGDDQDVFVEFRGVPSSTLVRSDAHLISETGGPDYTRKNRRWIRA